MGKLLILFGVLGPLAIDTFALSAALGIAGMKPRQRSPRPTAGRNAEACRDNPRR